MLQKPKDNRYYSLDFWRGVACLMIVVYHSSFYLIENPAVHISGFIEKLFFRAIDHCWVGVPVFFVISGYCITAACDSARSRPRAVKQYFFRRFRRIFPPFWIAALFLLLIVTVASFAGFATIFFDEVHPIHNPGSLSISQWIGNVTLTEIWRSHIAGDKTWFFLGPSWSLCYEEQFYAVCGILLFLTRQWFFRASAWMTAIIACLAAFHYAIKPLPIDGFFFDGRWLPFAAGMLVYYRIHHASPRFAKWSDVSLFATCCLVAFWRMKTTQTGIADEFFIGFLFALATGILYRWDSRIVASPLLRPITFCGTMCYSLYLIHWPIVKITSHVMYQAGLRGLWPTVGIVLPVSVACSIGVSWLFHLWVERRFLNTSLVRPVSTPHEPSVAPGTSANVVSVLGSDNGPQNA